MLLESLVVFVLVIAAFAIPAPASEPANDSAKVPHNARVVVLIASSFSPRACGVTHFMLAFVAFAILQAFGQKRAESQFAERPGGLVPGALRVAASPLALPGGQAGRPIDRSQE
jgi:hypothetical protein